MSKRKAYTERSKGQAREAGEAWAKTGGSGQGSPFIMPGKVAAIGEAWLAVFLMHDPTEETALKTVKATVRAAGRVSHGRCVALARDAMAWRAAHKPTVVKATASPTVQAKATGQATPQADVFAVPPPVTVQATTSGTGLDAAALVEAIRKDPDAMRRLVAALVSVEA